MKAESGCLFDIEVQIDKDFVNERGFYYGGRMGEDEFKPGSSYDQMPEVRVINLVDFYVRDDQGHVVEPVVLSYANNLGEVATEKFKMYHIQLPAFRKERRTLESVQGDTFLAWLYHNAVFLSKKKDYAEIRGTCSGIKFHSSRKLHKDRFWAYRQKSAVPVKAYVCESAIDALSLYLLLPNMRECSLFCSIGGVANQDSIMKIKSYLPVILAVDNDEAGSLCRARNPNISFIIPMCKDWNEDLQVQRQ